MKKIFGLLLVATVVVACDTNVTTTEQKLDSLGDKIENVAGKAWDSTKAEAKELKEKVENKLDNAADTADKKADSIDRKN